MKNRQDIYEQERKKNMVDSEYDIHRIYLNITIVIFKRVLYKDVHQKNWRELIDLVHEVNQQSIIWLDIEHPRITK
jgi:hypothetical protein